MKLYLLAFFALAIAMVYGQENLIEQRLLMDNLRTYGTGVVLVPIDRAAITITGTGMASTAAEAVANSDDLQRRINDTLRNFTIIDIRNGGLFLEPRYSDSGLSFAAHRSLSLVTYAVDTPVIIDSMISLGASNISFIFTPDFFAVERAQRQSLQLAVVDALFKAQAVLDMVNHCAYNISGIDIRNPNMELPSLTFNLFANMGDLYRRNLGNLGNNQQGGMGSPLNGMENMNQGGSNNNLGSSMASHPMLLGAAAPLLEGDREEVVSYVELWVKHADCSLGGTGIISDLTSSLDLSNIVGIAGGSLQAGSPAMSPVGSPASPIASPVEGEMRTRSVKSTMW